MKEIHTLTLDRNGKREEFSIYTYSPSHPSGFPPVVFVHGLGLDHRSFLPTAELLQGQGFTVYLYDQRGFGNSPPPPDSVEISDYTADLMAIVEAFLPQPFHLVGHSFGGMVALEYAVRFPHSLRTLTLLSTTAHNGRRASLFARAMANLCALGYEEFVRDPKQVAQVEAILTEAFPGMGVKVGHFRKTFAHPDPGSASAWQAIASFSVKERVLDLHLPVLVFHGTHDTWIPYSCGLWLGERLPQARWVSLDKGGHFPHLEASQIFHTELLDFLKKHSAGS